MTDLLVDLLRQPWVLWPLIFVAAGVAPIVFAVVAAGLLERVPTAGEIKWKLQHSKDGRK